MRSYADQKDPVRSAAGLVVVVLLHVLLIWALINGLGHRLVDVIKGPLVTKIIPQIKPPPPKAPPPPPPAAVIPPPPYIPPPLVNIQSAPSENAITTVTTEAPPPVAAFKAPPAPPAVPDQDVAPGSFYGAAPTYPDDAQENEIEGSASINCVFNTDGTTSDCRIESVKGSSEFGATTLEFVKTHKFRPAYRNGQPIAERVTVPFVFKLTDAQ